MPEITALGGNATLCTEDEDWPAQLVKASGGKGPSHAIDCVSGRVGATLARNLAPGGRLLVFGALSSHRQTEPSAFEMPVLAPPRVPQYAPRQCRAIYSVGGPNAKLVVAANLGVPEADYIVHTANAYPRLVELLKKVYEGKYLEISEGVYEQIDCEISALLKELGELPEKES
jgi:hypothetical protein